MMVTCLSYHEASMAVDSKFFGAGWLSRITIYHSKDYNVELLLATQLDHETFICTSTNRGFLGMVQVCGGGFPTMTCKSYLKLYTYVDCRYKRGPKFWPSHKIPNDIAFRSSKEYESSFRKQKICRRIQALTLMFNFFHQLLHDTFAWWRCDFCSRILL